ncbi:alpha-amylase family glycosyl hydrolase [Methanothrix sp.]|uniref:alpha-amylase family glycosyl hydrolase n=1 Tax=Methanothrix sp. TaxID=90426 RepID=UPI00329871FE
MRTATRHLEYLQDLGVNCIEIMPVTNISNTTDWGFLPIGYFGVDERFGKRRDMQRLIDSAHHVDGFRYDCVPNYWDGPTGLGYANLVYQTYSSSTWQNQTFDAAIAVARAEASELAGRLTHLGHRLGLVGYPAKETINEDTIQKSALQYIENHDHYRFVCNFRTISRDDNDLLKEGDRRYWYRVQRYLIAIMTARGIPLIWQGQELCENYFLSDQKAYFHFPLGGDYYEEIHGEDGFKTRAGEWGEISIPSNYGRVWTVEGGE